MSYEAPGDGDSGSPIFRELAQEWWVLNPQSAPASIQNALDEELYHSQVAPAPLHGQVALHNERLSDLPPALEPIHANLPEIGTTPVNAIVEGYYAPSPEIPAVPLDPPPQPTIDYEIITFAPNAAQTAEQASYSPSSDLNFARMIQDPMCTWLIAHSDHPSAGLVAPHRAVQPQPQAQSDDFPAWRIPSYDV